MLSAACSAVFHGEPFGACVAAMMAKMIKFITRIKKELNIKMPTKRLINFGTLFILFVSHDELISQSLNRYQRNWLRRVNFNFFTNAANMRH